ncbi:DUF1402 family protein [Stappia sp. MMSF_3263]|uniref:DUF1402 family protein n=1 Tax=Stappia sp. MMSF_3263 TaxID=3046693 RepID=UPI00273D701F|nr:DUF1402 family protein [Stappia sp. MMSF_3263]
MTRPTIFARRARAALRALAATLLLALPLDIAPLAGIPSFVSGAAAASTVPSGNRNARQPRIPFASARRTAASNSAYDAKFDRIIGVLRRDSRLIRDIKRVAGLYGIDPVHMLGAIIGEHTYNYDSLDSAQSYYVKALSYAGVRMEFSLGGEHVEDFVKRPQFSRCNNGRQDTNTLWNCYQRVWNASFRGKRIDGDRFPDKTFNEAFFQPLFAGQSFGLGQLSPLTVLMMSDKVARTSGFSKLSARNEQEIYRAAMDPGKSLHYMAAILRDAIDAYKSVGRVDISKNPGLTATLYNLGDPWARASDFRRRRAAGAQTWPAENYYGWLVNDKLEVIKSLL